MAPVDVVALARQVGGPALVRQVESSPDAKWLSVVAAHTTRKARRMGPWVAQRIRQTRPEEWPVILRRRPR